MEVLAPPAANWYVGSVALPSRRCCRVVAVAARECIVLLEAGGGGEQGGDSLYVHGILRYRPKLRISALAAFDFADLEPEYSSRSDDDTASVGCDTRALLVAAAGPNIFLWEWQRRRMLRIFSVQHDSNRPKPQDDVAGLATFNIPSRGFAFAAACRNGNICLFVLSETEKSHPVAVFQPSGEQASVACIHSLPVSAKTCNFLVGYTSGSVVYCKIPLAAFDGEDLPSCDGDERAEPSIHHSLVTSCSAAVQNISVAVAPYGGSGYAMVGCKGGLIHLVKISPSNQLEISDGETIVYAQGPLPSSPKLTAAQRERWWAASLIRHWGNRSDSGSTHESERLLLVAAGGNGQLYASLVLLESSAENIQLEWKLISHQSSPTGHGSTIFGISEVDSSSQNIRFSTIGMDRVFVFWKLSADFDENKISGRACSSLASIGGSIIDMEFVSPDNRCLISTSDPAGKIIIFDCQNINEGSENIEKEFLIQARIDQCLWDQISKAKEVVTCLHAIPGQSPPTIVFGSENAVGVLHRGHNEQSYKVLGNVDATRICGGSEKVTGVKGIRALQEGSRLCSIKIAIATNNGSIYAATLSTSACGESKRGKPVRLAVKSSRLIHGGGQLGNQPAVISVCLNSHIAIGSSDGRLHVAMLSEDESGEDSSSKASSTLHKFPITAVATLSVSARDKVASSREDAVLAAALSDNDIEYIATGDERGWICICTYDNKTIAEYTRFEAAPAQAIQCLTLSLSLETRQIRLALLSLNNPCVSVFKIAIKEGLQAQVVPMANISGHKGALKSITWMREDRLIVASDDHVVRCFSVLDDDDKQKVVQEAYSPEMSQNKTLPTATEKLLEQQQSAPRASVSTNAELIAKAKKKKSKPSPATPVPNYNNNAKPDLEFKIRPGSLLVGYHGGERSVIEMAFRRVCREPGKGLEIYRGICLEIYSESMALLEKAVESPSEDNSSPCLLRKLAFTLATWNSNTNLAASHYLGLLNCDSFRSNNDRQALGSCAFLQVAILGALGGPSVLETSLELLSERLVAEGEIVDASLCLIAVGRHIPATRVLIENGFVEEGLVLLSQKTFQWDSEDQTVVDLVSLAAEKSAHHYNTKLAILLYFILGNFQTAFQLAANQAQESIPALIKNLQADEGFPISAFALIDYELYPNWKQDLNILEYLIGFRMRRKEDTSDIGDLADLRSSALVEAVRVAMLSRVSGLCEEKDFDEARLWIKAGTTLFIGAGAAVTDNVHRWVEVEESLVIARTDDLIDGFQPAASTVQSYASMQLSRLGENVLCLRSYIDIFRSRIKGLCQLILPLSSSFPAENIETPVTNTQAQETLVKYGDNKDSETSKACRSLSTISPDVIEIKAENSWSSNDQENDPSRSLCSEEELDSGAASGAIASYIRGHDTSEQCPSLLIQSGKYGPTDKRLYTEEELKTISASESHISAVKEFISIQCPALLYRK